MSIIFWCWKPDICSGGRQIVPDIISKINNNSINKKVYAFIDCNIIVDNYTEEIYNKTREEYETPNFLIAHPSMINNKENIFVYPEDVCNNNPLKGIVPAES